MKKHLYTIAFYIITFITACDKFGISNKQTYLLAKTGEYELSFAEYFITYPGNLTKEDSLIFLKNYTDDWIKKKSLLIKAKKNLDKNQLNFSKQIEEYENALIIYTYQQALIKQQMDTVVSFKEISSYYQNHLSDFELKDNIIKVNYIKFNNTSTKLNNAKQLMRNNDDKSLQELKELCVNFASNFYFDSDSWLFFDDLLKEIPIKTYNQEEYIRNNRYVEIKDEDETYLVHIIDFKIKDSQSPLNIEQEKIREIILNKRNIDLLKKVENKIYQESIKNNQTEVFIK